MEVPNDDTNKRLVSIQDGGVGGIIWKDFFWKYIWSHKTLFPTDSSREDSFLCLFLVRDSANSAWSNRALLRSMTALICPISSLLSPIVSAPCGYSA